MRSATTLPQVNIRADGEWLSDAELLALTEVRVQQRLSMPTLAELYFRDPPGPLEVAERLIPGTSFTVALADYGDPLFVGEATAVEYIYGPDNEREIYIRGYDALHRLRKRQQVRVFDQAITLEKLARTLVEQTDINAVEVSEPNLKFEHLFQHQQSDLELLVEAAAQAGLYLTVRQNVLHLMTLAGKGEAQPLALGQTLLEVRIEVNTDAACDVVVATGWNSSRIERHQEEADQGRTGRNVRATISAGQVGGNGRRDLVNESIPDKARARALAQAELDQRAAAEVTLSGRAAGNPALQPGIPIEVSGVADIVAGRYILTETTHIMDAESGFVTEISTAPPPIQARPRSDVATYGVVSHVNDPAGLGRVRAKLPTYNNVQTDWMAVLCPGAGKNKGFISLPTVGDTVLVILTRENPGQGIVLGGLYGSQKLPDSGVSLGAIRRYTWLTPGGQKIQLNDRGNRVRLENDSGAYIELAGGEITIAGKKIDFKEI